MTDETEIKKLATALDNYTSGLKKQNKPGVKSSEFWVGILAIAIVTGADVFGIELNPETINAVLITAFGYIFGRSGVKAVENLKDKK